MFANNNAETKRYLIIFFSDAVASQQLLQIEDADK